MQCHRRRDTQSARSGESAFLGLDASGARRARPCITPTGLPLNSLQRAASAAALNTKGGQTAPRIARWSNRLQVTRRHLATALVAFQLVSDLLALIQAAEAGALDRGDVDKDILVAVLRLNETIAFLGVEPLDGIDGHSFSEMDGAAGKGLDAVLHGDLAALQLC